MALNIDSGRVDKRVPHAVPVRLWSIDKPAHAGRDMTENVSSHGARVRATHAFRPREVVVIASETSEFQTQALVVYCQQLSEGFAIGLQFDGCWSWESERPLSRAA